MITGDARATAVAIARDVNILTDDNGKNEGEGEGEDSAVAVVGAYEGRELFSLP